MTVHRNHFVAGVTLVALALGASVTAAPSVATIACFIVVVAAAISYGPQAILGLVVIMFPLLPANFQMAGLTVLQPQQLLIGLLLLVVVAEPRLWSQHVWRLRLLGLPVRLFAGFLAVGLLSAAVSPLPSSAFLGVAFYGVQLGGALLAACSARKRQARR